MNPDVFPQPPPSSSSAATKQRLAEIKKGRARSEEGEGRGGDGGGRPYKHLLPGHWTGRRAGGGRVAGLHGSRTETEDGAGDARAV